MSIKKRTVSVSRKTTETDITVKLSLDGTGKNDIRTGIDFLDHMLTLFSKHGLFDMTIKAKGDIKVDIHHTNEDTAIVLGQAFARALGDKHGIERFAWSFAPMDETLVRCVIDISGRPCLKITPRTFSCGKVTYTYAHFKHFLKSFTDNAKINMHIDILDKEDLHHALEASFKAMALAARQAVTIDKRKTGVPSTKGRID